MKKALATTAVLIALVAGVAGAATSATATPTKKTACSGCHKTASAVKVTVTKKSQTSKKATYSVKVTGGSGTAAWAVLASGKNLTHKKASTGTFSVTRGKTYKVWAVKKGTGSTSKKLVVK